MEHWVHPTLGKIQVQRSKKIGKGDAHMYCGGYNGKGCKNSNCEYRHRCPVLVSRNNPCDKPHAFWEHTGSCLRA